MPTPLRPNPLSTRKGPPPTLAPGEARAGEVTSFYSLDSFESAMNRNEFDDGELLDSIVSHIRDSDPQVSLKAINTFQKERDARARANGLLTSVTATTTKETPDGTLSLTFAGQSLAQRLGAELARVRPTPLHISTAPCSLDAAGQAPEALSEAPAADPLPARHRESPDPPAHP